MSEQPPEPAERGAIEGPDGNLRCPWGLSAPDYLAYHDEEWGRPVRGDTAIHRGETATTNGDLPLNVLDRPAVGARLGDRSIVSALELIARLRGEIAVSIAQRVPGHLVHPARVVNPISRVAVRVSNRARRTVA